MGLTQKEKHDGNDTNFNMKVLKTFQNDPLARRCAEGILINQIPIESRINNKNDIEYLPDDCQAPVPTMFSIHPQSTFFLFAENLGPSSR